ncbi:alpha/beta hydrolase fold domain-containing protein [Companilactobacillus zhachilii]|uniref:alpha/beta hydrolase fold domain-containing protein n=1 Tax=Companilactobacillus zhachilii TaxID=2304606 RepID=UPI001920E2FE|nr:alpha/beta hydrolase fold domain-containing protein [Companilactobacillus zhachilii]MBL3530442.1 alpha/beta hydrolase fold domain-containing protein [Companilactobacillus zhachilii]
MRVTNKMLAKDLRIEGRILRLIAQFNSENKFKRVQKLIIKLLRKHEPEDKTIEKRELFISRRDGDKIRLCVYCRKDLNLKEPVIGLLWIHGGGYAFGIPEIETKTIERFIQTSNTVVVSPDYRLSLEAPYPAALHDAYDALVWMKENATKLGIKNNQIPLYPMLDDRMLTQSMIDNDAPVWNVKANEAAWKLYLGDKFKTEEVPPYAAPARLKDYAELPPTFTFISS